MRKRNRNKKSKGTTVLRQFLKDKTTNTNYSGERSPYWDWSHNTKEHNESLNEHSRANPDNLISEDDNYQEKRAYFQSLLDKLSKILSKQEMQVFNLLQYDLTEKGIAKKMDISEKSVNGYRRRIIKKIKILDSKMALNNR